ncbi:hypothetical protein Bbelb_373020 [Branchiostoma belcheri]|nr:hypothetical protein Bbelb_373020 [Branchiostoma belcheri]
MCRTPVQHLSVSRLCVYRKFVMRNRSQKSIPHARPPFCRVVSTLAPHIPGTSAVDFVMAYMNAPPFFHGLRSRLCRLAPTVHRLEAVKKTDPPASLAKTRQDLNDTPTTATTRSGGLRCLSAQKRSLAVKKTDPPASLAKTRPDTPTTGTTATTRKVIYGREKRQTRPLVTPKQDLIPQLQELQQLRVVPIGAEVISGREKRRSRLLASPRQDLIPQLQQLQELRVTVNSRCPSAQKRSLAVKKTVPPASLAMTRPDTPTTGTTATTRNPPASLAKTRPDTPTTGTTGTTATTRSCELRCLAPIGKEAMSSREKRQTRPLALPRQDLIPQLQEQQLQQLRVHLSVSRLCVYRKFVMRNRSQKNIPHARPPFCRVVSTLAPHIPGTSAVDFVMAYMNALPKI